MRTFDLPEECAEFLEVTAALFHTRGMKINLAALLIPSVLALGGCTVVPPQNAPASQGGTASPQPKPQLPAPAPRPAPPPSPAPAPRADAASWRDLPQTPGVWTYAAEPGGSVVRFGQPGAGSSVLIRCDRARPAIVLQRAGFGANAVPATITTSSTQRRLTATPAATASAPNAAIPFEIAFAVRDPLLDAIAFSRGRFMLEMSGAQTLVLPVWSELGRVIEDCRAAG